MSQSSFVVSPTSVGPEPIHASAMPRAPYVAPKLVRLGSVRDLTLGGSGGRRTDIATRARP